MKGLSYSAKTTPLRTRGRAAEREKGGRTWGPGAVRVPMTETRQGSECHQAVLAQVTSCPAGTLMALCPASPRSQCSGRL